MIIFILCYSLYDNIKFKKRKDFSRLLTKVIIEAINDETFHTIQRFCYGQHKMNQVSVSPGSAVKGFLKIRCLERQGGIKRESQREIVPVEEDNRHGLSDDLPR
jgi:hypothetical protein